MVLTLDAGNSRLSCAFFSEDKIVESFSVSREEIISEDGLSQFLCKQLEKIKIEKNLISDISICSVVPSLNQILQAACQKVFGIEALFLNSKLESGLKIFYKNPEKLGTDRIAAAMGARALGYKENLIIVDMGTATTIDAIKEDGSFCGGAILAGIKLMQKALFNGTAQLPQIKIEEVERACGDSTAGAIQSGLYYGALGGIREIISRYSKEVFDGKKPLVIGCGGMAYLFKKEKVFDFIEERLVLYGLNQALKFNR